ncbi:hypothetical protein ACWGOQ_0019985 [Aquimarina sp. M1]
MSGEYIPLIQGEIYGLEIGIATKMSLWEHSKNLNYNEIKGEYLIGIGVGFTKAQQIRGKLKQIKSSLGFEEMVKLYKHLILKHIHRYGEFNEISDNFIKNIDNWAKEKIPEQIKKEVDLLLKDKKIQRAMDKVNKFNYEEFRLKSITEFDEIKSLLPALRAQKKKGEINSIESKKEKINIENSLREWIKKNE